jgi:hypothetical protein
MQNNDRETKVQAALVIRTPENGVKLRITRENTVLAYFFINW